MINVISQVFLSETHYNIFKKSGLSVDYGERFPDDELTSKKKYYVLIANGICPVTKSDMDKLPFLKIICIIGAGYDKIDLAGARQRGIAVTYGPGTNTDTVVEHAIAMMLGITRQIHILDNGMRSREWSSLRGDLPTLNKKKLGIVGLGNIGMAIASRCHLAFNMPVGFYNRRQKYDVPYQYFSSTEDLASWSEYLLICTPGGSENADIVNKTVLDNLGCDGYLINIGRGEAVNSDLLISYLRENRIRGAALDVIEDEPVIPVGFLLLKNTLLTPHVAALSPESTDAMLTLVLRNLISFFSGDSLITPVEL
ncbi:NAD(P)-dependent oxidoreductase [Erwinia mallotivora]|uniref:2-hydroxyacid dehydrogenase n=1 Tax=Erwinia mallotivora TaxID=69222 RepID=A0A014NCX2_9GAMM|nr:NAD(P)-dependent oxidoreductase [Erwinia mallotivora]EXU77228.1 2-hydroxyacid dehydrogenase [Erwinia mallotivora]